MIRQRGARIYPHAPPHCSPLHGKSHESCHRPQDLAHRGTRARPADTGKHDSRPDRRAPGAAQRRRRGDRTGLGQAPGAGRPLRPDSVRAQLDRNHARDNRWRTQGTARRAHRIAAAAACRGAHHLVDRRHHAREIARHLQGTPVHGKHSGAGQRHAAGALARRQLPLPLGDTATDTRNFGSARHSQGLAAFARRRDLRVRSRCRRLSARHWDPCRPRLRAHDRAAHARFRLHF